MFKAVLKDIKDLTLDSLFPKKCAGCGKLDVLLCEKCKEEIIKIKTPLCLGCGKISPGGKFCKNCRKKTNLTGVIISAHYEDGPLKEAIHKFKYDFIYILKDELSIFLADAIKNNIPVDKYAITYVPLHRKRESWRGFNQSKLLAKDVSEILGVEFIEGILVRNKQAESQISLKRSDRFKNVLDNFQARAEFSDKIKDKKIIIIDDIITTGATLNECAKILKVLGAKEVWGAVLGKH